MGGESAGPTRSMWRSLYERDGSSIDISFTPRFARCSRYDDGSSQTRLGKPSIPGHVPDPTPSILQTLLAPASRRYYTSARRALRTETILRRSFFGFPVDLSAAQAPWDFGSSPSATGHHGQPPDYRTPFDSDYSFHLPVLPWLRSVFVECWS